MKNSRLHLSGTLATRVTLLSNGKLGALALREADPWLCPRSNDEDVGQSKHRQRIRLEPQRKRIRD